MLTFSELVTLDRELKDTPALTLYLDGRSDNPAWRTAWRRALKQEETRLRNALADASHDEREAFSLNVEALEAHLAHRRGSLDAPGWLGVVANGQVLLDAPLRGPTPTYGHWGRGVALAPFLCVPNGEHGAWVVVADSRTARIFRCDDDGVHRIDTVRTMVHTDHSEAMGAAHGGKLHPGTRGGVRRDAAERERRVARAHMLSTLAEHVRQLDPVAPVFVGGTPQLVNQAVTAVEEAGVTPVVESPALGARARVVEIARAVREGLVMLRHAADDAVVDEVIRRFAADDLGATGAAATGRALDDMAVKELVLSDIFVMTQLDVAEVFVRSALAQHAAIDVVTGDAAQRLEEAGGAGVLLRFSPFRNQSVAEGELASV